MKKYLYILSAVGAFILSATVYAADVTPIRDGKSCEIPKYPKAALVNEESGTVQMAFLVGADG